jgi:hypothetical protein
MADTVAPMITDAVSQAESEPESEPEPRRELPSVAEQIYMIGAGELRVGLAWSASESRARYCLDFVDVTVSCPVRTAPGTPIAVNLDAAVEVGAAVELHALAEWILATVEPWAEHDRPEGPEPSARGTLGFGVSQGDSGVDLVWDPGEGQGRYLIRAELCVRAGPDVAWSPGRTRVTSRVTVDFPSPDTARELARWILATVPAPEG